MNGMLEGWMARVGEESYLRGDGALSGPSNEDSPATY
jgi:hypothetical protein